MPAHTQACVCRSVDVALICISVPLSADVHTRWQDPVLWEQAFVDEFEDSQARARPALLRLFAASDAFAISPRPVARRWRNLRRLAFIALSFLSNSSFMDI